jgi:CheY-like chemotaxis protein
MARILIVEDSADERQALADLLAAVPHEVCAAPNGKTVLALLRERPCDLVIVDMIMPEMDGVETILAVRRKYPDLKIMAVSGGGVAGFDKYLNLSRQLGVQQFLPKPFTNDEMLRAVQRLLAPH